MTMDRRTALKVMAAAGAATTAAPTLAHARERPEVPADAVGMLYDATRCIGCQTCVVACRDANKLEPEPHSTLYDDPLRLSGHTANIIKLHRDEDGDSHSFMKGQCMHCVDPACVAACMMGSFQKRDYGIVTWDPDRCIGCRYCQIACPFEIPKFQWDTPFPRIVKCMMCLVEAGTGEPGRLARGEIPACCDVCPVDAVIYGKHTDLLTDARQRIADHPDRYEPKIYGEHDGGGTQVLHLTAKGVPFETLGLPDLGEESVPQLPVGLQHAIYKGFIAPVVLYAALGAAVWRNRRLGRGDDETKDETTEVQPPSGGKEAGS